MVAFCHDSPNAPRQARRLIQQGAGTYWTIDARERLWLAHPVEVAEQLRVSFVSRPHQIPLDDLRHGRSRRRAALAATVYRTDERGSPISRRKVRERTGVAESTQRKYENQYGHATVVDHVHTKLTHISTKTAKSSIGHALW